MPIYELYMVDLKVSSEDYRLQFQLHKVTIKLASKLRYVQIWQANNKHINSALQRIQKTADALRAVWGEGTRNPNFQICLKSWFSADFWDSLLFPTHFPSLSYPLPFTSLPFLSPSLPCHFPSLPFPLSHSTISKNAVNKISVNWYLISLYVYYKTP